MKKIEAWKYSRLTHSTQWKLFHRTSIHQSLTCLHWTNKSSLIFSIYTFKFVWMSSERTTVVNVQFTWKPNECYKKILSSVCLFFISLLIFSFCFCFFFGCRCHCWTLHSVILWIIRVTCISILNNYITTYHHTTTIIHFLQKFECV